MKKMRDNEVLILNGPEVDSLLVGREIELIQAARMAYLAHANGESSLPHSTFLRFPNNQGDRIIALPAYLGDEWKIAGVKWVASFPGNPERGMDRASAVVVLNSARTGRPEAILEGSIISAKRTAASAALAAQYLFSGNVQNVHGIASVGMIGCGLINFEIARFLFAVRPEIERLFVHDLDKIRGERFKRKCREAFPEIEVEIVKDVETVLGSSNLISIATTAIKPYIDDLSAVRPGSAILHVSLRDLSPQAILSCDNVVDDVDHVCRAQTSAHLAEELVGNRDFIRCALSDILIGKAAARDDAGRSVIFSPFGLGILDLAVSKLVRDLGLEQGRGIILDHFFPRPWAEDD